MSDNLRLVSATAADAASLTLVCLVALGMALSFLSADRDSPTSRALAVCLMAIALSLGLGIVLPMQWSVPPVLYRWFPLSEVVSMIAMLEWILRVRRTVPSRDRNTRWGDYAVRLGQGAALLYGILSVLFPDIRTQDFLGATTAAGGLYRLGFWLFAVPVMVVMACGGAAIIVLFNRRPDPLEKGRLLAMMAAMPFLATSFILPLQYVAVAIMIGLMIFLLGSVHYHVMQGQRGQFMSRFLSPQVAELVRERGLAQAMQHQNLEITVVCCDIRGFTAYAGSHPSEQVIELLERYYEVVGERVAECGATIKDYAGDGILILVGAPLPLVDHAARGLRLARGIRDAVAPVLAQRGDAVSALGIGVGVATGRVTVGTIGSASRLEYAAVGSTVNLASRLCEQARHGEILADVATIEAVADTRAERRSAERIKGFGEDVPYYALA